MAIQINASARLQAYARYEVSAASAKDAGQIVMWLQKALDWKGKKTGKAGQDEGMEFKKKLKSGATVWVNVSLDHTQEGSPIFVEGGIFDGPIKKKVRWVAKERTGRKSILEFKDELRRALVTVSKIEGAEDVVEALKALVRAKAKVE